MYKAHLGRCARILMASKIKDVVAHIAARGIAQVHMGVLFLQLLHNFVSRNSGQIGRRTTRHHGLIPRLAPQIILDQRIANIHSYRIHMHMDAATIHAREQHNIRL